MLQGLVAASTPRMRLFVGQRKEVIESIQEVITAERPGIPLIIKDSWQYPERDEEGELLCKATAKAMQIARALRSNGFHCRGMKPAGADRRSMMRENAGVQDSRCLMGTWQTPVAFFAFFAEAKGRRPRPRGCWDIMETKLEAVENHKAVKAPW
ncbi:hypothetical protein BGZ61DRAFT_524358 [Ilyonectria robusta]|uniref:uncharacterized protein n=1 Tax=Ilyonectria robusta TaxID=1079257 RepID=UPI001E8DD437|nr:uncharacterized protein BGZ61DRAFT_524358 [Ilyonectria robusta]KAH8653037.1 hypothetical protein BGZ61DRAFT_524358 [Ilyonectria robusta]